MKIALWIVSIILGLALLYFLIPGFFALFVNPKKNYTNDSKLFRTILNAVSVIALKIMRVKIQVSGAEKLPHGQKLLFVGNHRSNFDPIITWYSLRDWKIAYISKASNFKIPIFGRIIRRCCFMAIDRESPRKAINTINQASELLKSKEVSVGVYPEGTRSKNGELLPFHNGVLRIAQKANASIAVVILKGTEKIHKNYPFHRTYVEMTIAEVIPSEQVSSTRSAELGDKVRNIIENNLK